MTKQQFVFRLSCLMGFFGGMGFGVLVDEMWELGLIVISFLMVALLYDIGRTKIEDERPQGETDHE